VPLVYRSNADRCPCCAVQKAAAPWNTTNGKFNRFSQTAMVTPAISGIRNKDALQVGYMFMHAVDTARPCSAFYGISAQLL
jgi:hypothetical protein